jgi:uncharacterized membrane protein
MVRAAGWLWNALLIVLCVAWQLLAHFNVSEGDTEYTRYLLLALPLAALAYWTVRHARNKPLWLAILGAAFAATFILEQRNHLGLAAAFGVPHAAAYGFLLFLFGHTLLPGREALITRVAGRIHGVLPPYMAAYTRRVTAAWCVFFAAQLGVSAALFVYAPLDTWSAFVNLLNVPLLVLMFVGEYAYRVTRYRDFPHVTITQAARAFARYGGFKSAGTR